MKRRKFLNRLGYSLPASLMLPALISSCNKDDDNGIGAEKRYKGYKVVVVGAGAAGLHAGWYLKERGFQVTILEASGRIGGRIRPHSGFADYDIELGAEKIYGGNTPWHQIVSESGFSLDNLSNRENYYSFLQDPSNGNEPPVKNAGQASQYSDYLAVREFINNIPNYSGNDISVESSFATTGLWNMFGVVNGLVGNRAGTVNSRLGIKGYSQEKALQTIDGQEFTLKDATLLSVLEQKFESVLGEVEKNTQVRKIDYQGEKVILTDQSNRTWEADRVVVTVPISVLKDGDITFLPALPSIKQDAMQKIGIGAGMKIHLEFSNPFWNDLLADDLGSIFGHNFLPEIYISSQGRSETPVLTALVMGERAEQFASMGDTAVNVILSHLDDLFATGNIASQSWVQGGAHIVDWKKEPFIRGAYSFPIVGGGLIYRKELAEPVNGQLFFAGEATHADGHSGTVHGAIESAIRVSAEVEVSIG